MLETFLLSLLLVLRRLETGREGREGGKEGGREGGREERDRRKEGGREERDIREAREGERERWRGRRYEREEKIGDERDKWRLSQGHHVAHHPLTTPPYNGRALSDSEMGIPDHCHVMGDLIEIFNWSNFESHDVPLLVELLEVTYDLYIHPLATRRPFLLVR